MNNNNEPSTMLPQAIHYNPSQGSTAKILVFSASSSSGQSSSSPQPFPAGGLLELWPLLEQALKTRILAVLPWDGI